MKAVAIITEAILFFAQHFALVAAAGAALSLLVALGRPTADLGTPFVLALGLALTGWSAAAGRGTLQSLIGEI